MSDLVSTFRIRTNAYAPTGLGYGMQTIKTIDPFTVNFTLPQFMVVGDTYNVSVSINNFSPNTLNAIPFLV